MPRVSFHALASNGQASSGFDVNGDPYEVSAVALVARRRDEHLVALSAQTPRPTFEVASIRAQTRAVTGADLATAGPRLRPGGVFNATHATVGSLIAFAYELRGFQILGGADWDLIRRNMFAIDARAGGDVPTAQVRLMVQSLLEDRFKLVTHMEQRDMRFLSLTLVRNDGRLGPYLGRVDECTTEIRAEVEKKFPICKTTSAGGAAMRGCSTTSQLAELVGLGLQSELPTIDKTGLSGRFVYDLRYRSTLVLGGAAPAVDPNLPSFEAALERR